MAYNPRRSNGTRRNAIRARWKAMGLPCAICGRAIDYNLKTPHPMSFEVDEIIPVSKGGDPLDFGNTQPVHRCCNQRKGNGSRWEPPEAPRAINLSRSW